MAKQVSQVIGHSTSFEKEKGHIAIAASDCEGIQKELRKLVYWCKALA